MGYFPLDAAERRCSLLLCSEGGFCFFCLLLFLCYVLASLTVSFSFINYNKNVLEDSYAKIKEKKKLLVCCRTYLFLYNVTWLG